MTGLDLGEKAKVRYVDDRTYTIRPPNEFIGRVEAIFLPSVGEITRGQTFDELMAKKRHLKTRILYCGALICPSS